MNYNSIPFKLTILFLAYLYLVLLWRAWWCLTLVCNQKLNEMFSSTRLHFSVNKFCLMVDIVVEAVGKWRLRAAV